MLLLSLPPNIISPQIITFASQLKLAIYKRFTNCFEVHLSHMLVNWSENVSIFQYASFTSPQYLTLVIFKTLQYLYLFGLTFRSLLVNLLLVNGLPITFDKTIHLFVSFKFFQLKYSLAVYACSFLIIIKLDHLFHFKVTATGLNLTRYLVIENGRQLSLPQVQLTRPLATFNQWRAMFRYIWNSYSSNSNLHFKLIKQHQHYGPQMSPILQAQVALLSYALDYLGTILLRLYAVTLLVTAAVLLANTVSLIDHWQYQVLYCIDILLGLATLWHCLCLGTFSTQLIHLFTFTASRHILSLNGSLASTTQLAATTNAQSLWQLLLQLNRNLTTYRRDHHFIVTQFTSLDAHFIAQTSLLNFTTVETLKILCIAMLLYRKQSWFESLVLVFTVTASMISTVIFSIPLIRISSTLSSGSAQLYRGQLAVRAIGGRFSLQLKLKLHSSYELIHGKRRFYFHVGHIGVFSWAASLEYLITSSAYLMYICKMIQKF